MFRRILRWVAIGVLTLPGLAVNAAPIAHTYDLQASGFTASGGLIFPYGPLNMAITITFDPSFSNGTTPVDSFLSPLDSAFGPFVFQYDVATTPKLMTIGDNCQGTPFARSP